MIETLALATMTLALGVGPDIPEEVLWTRIFDAIDEARKRYDVPPLSAEERMRKMLGEDPREGEYLLTILRGKPYKETDPLHKIFPPDQHSQYFLAILRRKEKEDGVPYWVLYRKLTVEMDYAPLRLGTDSPVERFEKLLYLAYRRNG